MASDYCGAVRHDVVFEMEKRKGSEVTLTFALISVVWLGIGVLSWGWINGSNRKEFVILYDEGNRGSDHTMCALVILFGPIGLPATVFIYGTKHWSLDTSPADPDEIEKAYGSVGKFWRQQYDAEKAAKDKR